MKKLQKKKSVFLVISIIILFVCSACSKEDIQEESSQFEWEKLACFSRVEKENVAFDLEKKGTASVSALRSYVCDLGVFSFDTEKYILQFEDFSTGNISPMCVQPNCTHDNAMCSAWFPFEKSSIVYPYFDGTYFYFYSENENTCYRQNTDGTDRKEVFCLKDKDEFVLYSISSWGIWEYPFFYFTYTESKIDAKTNQIKDTQKVAYADLQTGKITELPITFSEGDLSLHGKVQNYLYFQYDDKNAKRIYFIYNMENGEIIRFFENHLAGGKNSHMNIQSMIEYGFIGAIEFDTNTASEHLDNMWFFGTLVIADLFQQKEYVLSDILYATWELEWYEDAPVYATLSDDKKEKLWMRYDMNTKQNMQMETYYGEYLPIEETGNYYICRKYQNEEVSYWRVLKAEYRTGIFEPIQVVTY